MDAFIEATLVRLLATSIHTIVLTVLVWSLCRSMPRLSPAAQCWLWWLVALQAVVGLCVDPIQLPWLPRTASSLPQTVTAAHWTVVPAQSAATQFVAGNAAPSWPSAILLLWVLGIAAMGWSTLRHWRRARELLKASTPCTETHLLQSLARICAAAGMRSEPGLRLSQHIDSPVVVGHLRPVLLLSSRAPLQAEELDMALAHELTHLRRGDLWWGCVPALARHLFFFNPFVHLAAREYAIAREADCDAAVVAMVDHSRRDYGQLLLRLGASAGAGARLAVASPTFHALSRRLAMLQNTTFLPRAGSIALLILVAAVGVMPLRLVAAARAAVAPTAIPQSIVASDATPTQPDTTTDVAGPDQSPAEVKEKAAAEPGESLESRRRAFLQRMRFIDALQREKPQKETPLATNQVDAAPGQPAPAYTGERMSANFQDIDLRELLQLIAKTSGRNMLISDSVTGKITLRVDNMPWDQLLDMVIQAKGLEKRLQNDVIVVGRAGELAAREQAALAPMADWSKAPAPAPDFQLTSGDMRVSADRTRVDALNFSTNLPPGYVSGIEIKSASISDVANGAVADSIRITSKDAEWTATRTRHTLEADGSLSLVGERLQIVRTAAQ